MSMNVVRFPPRIEAVLILPEPLRGVYLVAREHGWVFGSRRDAEREAQAISRTHTLPIRRAA
jgi:hypothetical protein